MHPPPQGGRLLETCGTGDIITTSPLPSRAPLVLPSPGGVGVGCVSGRGQLFSGADWPVWSPRGWRDKEEVAWGGGEIESYLLSSFSSVSDPSWGLDWIHGHPPHPDSLHTRLSATGNENLPV